MSHQYSNRSFVPTNNNSSRRFHQQESQNDFSYFQYPPHRQINNNRNNFSRITASATNSASTPHYHFENPSAASFTRRPPWFDNDWNDHNRLSHQNNHTKHQRTSTTPNSSNSQLHHERKRPRQNEHEREQQYRSHHYQPYPNHRPTQIQTTNPTPRHVPSPSFSRSFDYDVHNRHIHHPSSAVVSPHRQSIPSFNTRHRNEMTFEPPTHRSPLVHRTSMSTHIQPRPSPSFLLTNLLHRVIDAHAASYSDNPIHHHHSPTASIDLIAFGWMTPNHEIFSLPTAFSIQFGDFFDLIIPDETPVVGLTDSELERIPRIIYKNHQSDDKCAVCLSEYKAGEKLKRLKCKHDFHSECIDPWLKTSTRCPICRGEQTN